MCDEAKATLDSDFAIRCYSFLKLGDELLRLCIACIVYCMLVLMVQLSYTRSLEKTFDKWNIYNVIKEWLTYVVSAYIVLVYVIGSRVIYLTPYGIGAKFNNLKRTAIQSNYKKVSHCNIYNIIIDVNVVFNLNLLIYTLYIR